MGDAQEQVEPDKVVGFEGEAHEVSYTKRDLLLYALGIGCVLVGLACGWLDGCFNISMTVILGGSVISTTHPPLTAPTHTAQSQHPQLQEHPRRAPLSVRGSRQLCRLPHLPPRPAL